MSDALARKRRRPGAFARRALGFIWFPVGAISHPRTGRSELEELMRESRRSSTPTQHPGGCSYPYVPIPERALEAVQRKQLKPVDVLILAHLVASQCGPEDLHPATLAELARTVGRTREAILRSFSRLAAIGLVRMAEATAAGREGGMA
jgi:hypothetical protein